MSIGTIASQAFSPNKLAGLQFWLDATDSVRTIASPSGFVSEWGNKYVNGNDAIQTTGTNQPKTGGSLNGVDAITWDGVNDSLVASPTASLAGIFSTGGTLLFVSRANIGTDFPVPLHIFDHANMFVGSGGSRINIIASFSGTNGVFAGLYGLNIPRLVTMTYDGSNAANVPTFYRDGVPLTTDIQNVPVGNIEDGNGQISIGNNDDTTRPFDGELGEMVLYDRILTSTELVLLHAYFLNKWRINITFPFAFSADFSSDFS